MGTRAGRQLPGDSGLRARVPAGDDPGAGSLRVTHVSKRFGTTQAVADASLTVGRGELAGIAGHNGAGKSTLLGIVMGRIPADAGTVEFCGVTHEAGRPGWHPAALGIRAVHQELSLAPTLRVDETAAVFDRSAGGLRWRRTAWSRLASVLDEMFPGHGIGPAQLIRDLSLTRRQMIECACALLPGRTPASLLILDEPTSSLDSPATAMFYAFLRRQAEAGISALITTHRLNEMADHLDRIYLMRDGQVIGQQVAGQATKESLVRAMGVGGRQQAAARSAPGPAGAGGAPRPAASPAGQIRVEISETAGEGGRSHPVQIQAGEIVGLGGLEGHGQLAVLEALSRAAGSRRGTPRRTTYQRVRITGSAAYVSGDRGVRGIFRYWSTAHNVTISSLAAISRAGFVSRTAESRVVAQWRDRLGIRGAPADPVVSLSGGTQQKALMARALATGSEVLLLEDPTRGVDQSTKEDFYALLRDLAGEGKCVVWYSTENEELQHCDRVLVFRGGRIAGVLLGSEASEEAIISHSFAESH